MTCVQRAFAKGSTQGSEPWTRQGKSEAVKPALATARVVLTADFFLALGQKHASASEVAL